MKSLASRMKNLIGIYEKKKVQGKIGTTYEDVLIKKIWAEIKFRSGNLNEGQGNTEYSNTKFRVRVRKTKISEDNYIVYKGLKFEIEYIYPDFKNNSFIDLNIKLKTE